MQASSPKCSRDPSRINRFTALAAGGAIIFMFLGSCGNQKTVRMDGDPAGGRAGNASASRTGIGSEFDRLHSEMIGGLDDDSQSLAGFTSALDNYLADAAGNGGINNSNSIANADLDAAAHDVAGKPPSNTNVQPGVLDHSQHPASSVSRNLTSSNRSGSDAESTPTVPEVAWVEPSIDEIDSATDPMTPADRLELVGSAADREKLEQAAMEDSLPPNTGITSSFSSGSRSIPRDELIVLLAAQLQRDASDSAVPLREHLVNAAMMMLDEGRRIDPKELYDLNERERELLSAYQDFFAAVGTQLYDTRDPEILVDEVNKLSDRLGSNDLLEIPNFKICTSVRKFGTYEEFKSKKFIRGRAHDMIAYVEVANFSPRPAEDGQFKTVLTQETELYTESDGTIVYRQPAVTVTDECRNKRTDFFLVRHVTLPSNLSVGSYYLKVRVRDEHSNQQAEAVIPIQIIASE